MNAWSHLPNAAHIDRVIKSVKSHPEVWNAAWDAAYGAAVDAEAAWAAAGAAAWGAAWIAAWGEAWNAARNMARNAARDAAWNTARDAARIAAWIAARDAAQTAILALIAYDDSAKYLDMPSDQLKTWAILSEEPTAVLLLPAVIAFERISELETA